MRDETYMQLKPIMLSLLTMALIPRYIHADAFANASNVVVRRIGDYTMMRGTNGHYVYANLSEFWNGIWKESTNGLRTQLRIYRETNVSFAQEGIGRPISTNLMLRVEWGIATSNSGGGYLMAPNGKFAKFELQDANGSGIRPRPQAGTNLLERTIEGYSGDVKLTYPVNLPVWASPLSGTLEAAFPRMTATNLYPRYPDGGIAGETGSSTNRPPMYIGLLKMEDLYCITNEGDYTLTVQPVLYKQYDHPGDSALLDRVDLPSVSTKIHLVPNQ